MFTLSQLSSRYAVCRLPAGSAMPAWATAGEFFSITGTSDELSVVCEEHRVPADVGMQGGWRALKVEGPLDFALTGVLAGLSSVLAQAGISIFALSTYDTDYLLLGEQDLGRAIVALRAAGYTVL